MKVAYDQRITGGKTKAQNSHPTEFKKEQSKAKIRPERLKVLYQCCLWKFGGSLAVQTEMTTTVGKIGKQPTKREK